MSVSSARITSNTSYYMIALTTQKILAFVYFIIIARFIGAEDIGSYALAVSFIQILAIFIDIGLSPSITRESSRNPEIIKRHFSHILGFKLIMSIIAIVILVTLANLFGYSELRKELLYLASAVMILDSFTLTFYAMLRGLHHLKNESIGVIIYQVLVFTIALVGLYNGTDVHILIIALIAGSIFNFMWSFYSLRKYADVRLSISYDWQALKPFFVIALPFGITALFIKLYQMGDTVILSLLADELELGWYSVAHKLVFAFEFIPLAIVASVFPALSSYYATDREKMRIIFEKSSFVLMLIALPLMLGGFVLAQPMILALYGEEFLPSTGSLQLLLMSLLFLFLNYPLSSLLGAIDRQKVNMYFMGGAACMSVLLNILFIPLFGGIGAALALFISLMVLFFTYIYYIRVIVRLSLLHYFVSLMKVLFVSIIMAGVAWFADEYVTWWLAMLVAAGVYGMLIFGLKFLTMNDIKLLYTGMKGSRT